MRNTLRRVPLFLFLVSLLAPIANAQYFGRNKVQWEAFHFRVLQTEHFDIYYYEQEADVVKDIGRMAERWYFRLSKTFNHTFQRKPIVLYANSADFQQTTTTGGIIGEGTGGFTDEFMNRVVLPLTGDYSENDHVLGHEIVHVFQYDIAKANSNNRRRFNLEQLPLWLVEGMAEYFSKGRIDPLTSMWIRDATIMDRMPDLKTLTRDPRYFPYRYGEALMAYIGGRFGDEAVVRYFLAAGLVGIDAGFDRTLGLNSDQVFRDWHEAARELYNPVITDRPMTLGAPLIGRRPEPGKKKRPSSDLNVGPSLSPDGRYLAFLSTRELFDVDLFLADAKTGRVIRRLVSSDRDAHYDALRFIDSAGSWSPDSKRLAFITFEKGDNFLGIVDAEGRSTEHIRVPNLDAMSSVSWSPDGRSLVISGQRTGVTDLFIYNLDTKNVRQLTNDKFADMQPAWSPDGKTIAFVTDRGEGTRLENLYFSQMGIATIDVATAAVTVLPLFAGAHHINPQWGANSNTLYFIANPEGVPDVYRYTIGDNRIERITHVQTGVSGITEMSPALTVANTTGEVVVSIYEGDNYNLYSLPANGQATVVAATAPSDIPRAALLPPYRQTGSVITAYLQHPEEGLLGENIQLTERGYSPNLHLAYLGPPTIGVGADQFGFGVGGSISAYYSDILGQHNVGFTFQGGGSSAYGSFADQIGGELFYLNQTHRFNWGVDTMHTPYVSLAQGIQPTTYQGVPADDYLQIREVQTIDDVSGVMQYPFSSTRRIEGQVGYQHYGYKAEVDHFIVVGDQIVDEFTDRLPGSFNVGLSKASVAFVGDSSVYGFISPVRGTRYRYEVETLTGDLKFNTALADYRKYVFKRPFTLAVRGLHYGRYGSDSESPQLSPLYLGQGSLVRGYDPYSVDISECVGGNGSTCPVYDRLIGSRIAAGSIEARIPLTGTQEFGLINAPALPTELFAFGDVGAAWRSGDSPKIKWATNTSERVPVASVGVGIRILLAYIPLEFYAAKPFQRPDRNVEYGFNIIPGW
ncbi:MAG: PD40 domain-containing protein [Acidobacteria bacterium]|nr:PD40 domain-containing protein [Acidobacteriota bacterium]